MSSFKSSWRIGERWLYRTVLLQSHEREIGPAQPQPLPTSQCGAFAPHRHVKTIGEADYRRRLRDLTPRQGSGRLRPTRECSRSAADHDRIITPRRNGDGDRHSEMVQWYERLRIHPTD